MIATVIKSKGKLQLNETGHCIKRNYLNQRQKNLTEAFINNKDNLHDIINKENIRRTI